jgi:hypothetical protein
MRLLKHEARQYEQMKLEQELIEARSSKSLIRHSNQTRSTSVKDMVKSFQKYCSPNLINAARMKP